MWFVKLVYNFIEIALRHGCSHVELQHIFRKPFPKNTSGWLLLCEAIGKVALPQTNFYKSKGSEICNFRAICQGKKSELRFCFMYNQHLLVGKTSTNFSRPSFFCFWFLRLVVAFIIALVPTLQITFKTGSLLVELRWWERSLHTMIIYCLFLSIAVVSPM